MALPPVLQKLFSHVNNHASEYKNNLREAVAIKSVSTWYHARDDCIKMMHWMEKKMKSLGAETHFGDLGNQTFPSGEVAKLPPILYGTLGSDPKKKTVLIYGHLDVQPALVQDGWDTEPFTLVEKDGKLFGRGSTDDKGPVLGWYHALQAYQAIGEPIPVNVRFVFEGMEESGSEGLDEFLLTLKDTLLKDVDYVCISDNYWLGNSKPCITYGLRGMAYFHIEVVGAEKDLHSGVFGGTVHEALGDLVYLMNGLVDVNARILVDGIYDQVDEISEAEQNSYHPIEFNVQDYKKSIGTPKLLHGEDKVKLLMHRWRFPTLSLHGIEGAFSESGSKTVIPSKVIGKFSIRLVPSMTPEDVEKKVVAHVKSLWEKRGSGNHMKVAMVHGGKPWTENPDHPHYIAARKATKHVYKVDPDLSREGGSIPVTLTFQELTGKNVLLLPMGAGDDGAHSQNEKINVVNYIEGTKLLGAYLHEVSQLQ